MSVAKRIMSLSFGPLETYIDVENEECTKLTNVELSVSTTNICNMRCEHRSFGYVLLTKDMEGIPVGILIKKVDEVKDLRYICTTDRGEQMLSEKINSQLRISAL